MRSEREMSYGQPPPPPPEKKPELHVVQPFSEEAAAWASQILENIKGYETDEVGAVVSLESVVLGERNEAQAEHDAAADELLKAENDTRLGRNGSARTRKERAAYLEENAAIKDERVEALEAMLREERKKIDQSLTG